MSELEDNLQMLHFIGIWVDKTEKKGRVFYLRRALVLYIGWFNAYTICVSHPVYIYQHLDDFSEVSEGLANLGASIFVATVFLTYVLQNDKLLELVTSMRRVYEFKRPADDYATMLADNAKKTCHFFSHTVARMAIVVTGVSIIFVGFNVVQEKDLEKRLKTWYPVDVKAPVYFEIAVVMFFLNLIPIVTMLVSTYLMLICMFVLLVPQLKILSHKIRKLRSAAEDAVREKLGVDQGRGSTTPREETLEMSVLDETKMIEDQGVDQEIVSTTHRGQTPRDEFLVDVELAENISEFQRAESLKDGTKETREMICSSLNKIEVDIEMQAALKECIAHHCAILKFLGKFEEFWNPYFSGQLASGLIHGTLIMINISGLALDSGDTILLIHFLNISMNLTILGIICYISQTVTKELEFLKESVYDCDWLESSESFKRSIRIMISMTNQPYVIRAAKFVPLSMVTYRSVMNSAYSYYMVLNSLK